MPPLAEQGAASRTGRLAALVLVAAAAIPLWWPGDVPFINDEPILVGNAVAATAEGRLAPLGLQGTYGAIYGPLPTWTYQVLVAISRDLVVVAALHALLMSSTVAIAVWWLSRSLRLWPWFAPVALLSPYFWFYARALWDNTYQLPLGGLAMAGYAAFLATQSSLGLRVAVAALWAIPLVHLMGLSLVVPMAAHMLLVNRHALWQHKYSLGAISVVALLAAWPYWTYLLRAPASPPVASVMDGWLFPLFGARLLGAGELDYFFGSGPVTGGVFSAAARITALTRLLAWGGIVVAAASSVGAMRARAWTPRAHVAAIAVAALAVQSVVHGISAKFEHPHYHNGVWIAVVLLAWLAVDALRQGRAVLARSAAAVTVLVALGNTAAVGALALGIHRTHGTREVYGATLANQQRVARRLAEFAPGSVVENHVIMWERFPHTLALLRQLNTSRRIDRPRRRIDLRYASDDPESGAIVVIDAPPALP